MSVPLVEARPPRTNRPSPNPFRPIGGRSANPRRASAGVRHSKRESGRETKRSSKKTGTEKSRHHGAKSQPAAEEVEDVHAASILERDREIAALEKKGNFAATTSAACFLSAILAGAIMSPIIAILFLPEIQESQSNQKEKTRRVIQKAEGTWKPCYDSAEMNRECCNHYGSCVQNSLTGQRKCKCDDGSESAFCLAQTPSDPCDGVKCQNGGECKKLIGDRTYCPCPLGFVGLRCETKLTPCNPNPCLHGGTCHDRIWTFACECKPEKAGRLCERAASLCSTLGNDLRHKCYNGVCANLHGGATFTCVYCGNGATELCRENFLTASRDPKDVAPKECVGGLTYVSPSRVGRGDPPVYQCFMGKDKEIFIGK